MSKVSPKVYTPSPEVDNRHCATHLPYRNGCPMCFKARNKALPGPEIMIRIDREVLGQQEARYFESTPRCAWWSGHSWKESLRCLLTLPKSTTLRFWRCTSRVSNCGDSRSTISIVLQRSTRKASSRVSATCRQSAIRRAEV